MSSRKSSMYNLIAMVNYYDEGDQIDSLEFNTVHQMRDWRREFYRFRYELKHTNAEMYEQSRWLHTEVYEKAILLNDDEDVLKILVFKRAPRKPYEPIPYIEEV